MVPVFFLATQRFQQAFVFFFLRPVQPQLISLFYAPWGLAVNPVPLVVGGRSPLLRRFGPWVGPPQGSVGALCSFSVHRLGRTK